MGSILKQLKRASLFIGATISIFLATNAYAAGQSLGDVSKTLTGITGGLGKMMYGVSFVAGVAFILAGAVQYKYYRDNPQMIRLSTPIMYFLLGLALVALPFLGMISSASFATK